MKKSVVAMWVMIGCISIAVEFALIAHQGWGARVSVTSTQTMYSPANPLSYVSVYNIGTSSVWALPNCSTGAWAVSAKVEVIPNSSFTFDARGKDVNTQITSIMLSTTNANLASEALLGGY